MENDSYGKLYETTIDITLGGCKLLDVWTVDGYI